MNMYNSFILLENTDILMVGKDTFTIERLKELLTNNIRNIFNFNCQDNLTIAHKLRQVFIIGTVRFNTDNSKWFFPIEGQECQLLKIGSQGWQKGKMRIQVFIKSFAPTHIEVNLEFCPEKILTSDSSLDDIRQSQEYKQL